MGLMSESTGSEARLHVLWVHVREVLERVPLDGSAYVFRNRSERRLKVLVVSGQRVWLSALRLHQGRFVWPASNGPLWLLTRAPVRRLCTGVDWQRLSCDTSSLGRIF